METNFKGKRLLITFGIGPLWQPLLKLGYVQKSNSKEFIGVKK